jgi:DNA-binding transcriptional MerR regulator
MQPLTSDSPYVSVSAAAKMLGVSIQALRLWDAANILVPVYRTPGGHRRYSIDQLLKHRDRDRQLEHPRPD